MVQGIRKRARRFIRHAKKRRDTEVYVISFPKCGRTWLRMLLGRVIQLEFNRDDADPTAIFKITREIDGIPTIRFTHDDDPQWKRPGEIQRNKRRYRKKKVVFLVRDPRDAVVSNYFQKRFRNFGKDAFEGTISEFIRHDVGGLASLITFYNVWAKSTAAPKDYLLLRYEALHKDTERELRSLLGFLGLDGLRDSVITEAVQESTFENMRQMEEADSIGKNRMRPRDTNDPRTFKMRKGQVGSYAEQLTDEDIEYIRRELEEHLDPSYPWYLHEDHA